MTIPNVTRLGPLLGRPARVALALACASILAAGCDGTPTEPPSSPELRSDKFLAASGTLVQTGVLSEEVRFAGGNTFVTLAIAATIDGTLSGTVEDRFTVVIHPNGTFTAQGTSVCDCSINGSAGIITLRLTDAGRVIDGVPHFAGRWIILDATGALSGLRGSLEIDGAVDVSTNLSTIDYSGWVHFSP